jgi:hypothetical protein
MPVKSRHERRTEKKKEERWKEFAKLHNIPSDQIYMLKRLPSMDLAASREVTKPVARDELEPR